MSKVYTFEDMKRAGKVVDLAFVQELLATTEPVSQTILETDGSMGVRVHMPEKWNLDLKALDDSLITSCTITVEGVVYQLSKRAILTLLSMIGFSDRYSYKTPGPLLETHVNYWLENKGVGKEDTVKLITKGEFAVGFMPAAYPVISNLEVVSKIADYMEKAKLGRILVDPNIVHNYVQTEFRLILENSVFEVKTKRNGVEEVDRWHFGVHISNSLISSTTRPLTLSGFMVEENSMAAILPEFSNLAGYTRSVAMDVEDLNGWIKSTLDQILSILPAEAEMIEHMPEHSLVGKVGTIATDIFRSMKVHRKVQEISLENLTVSGDMTAYGVMHALAKAVSNSTVEFPSKVVNHIQQVCGTLPSRTEEICGSCGRLHLVS